jgi:hypothetical protein
VRGCSSGMVSASGARGVVRSARRTQDTAAFAPGGGGQPAGKRGRITQGAQPVHQHQPDALSGILGVGVIETVPAADGPDQRGVPLHQGIPSLLVAVPGAGHQAGDHWVIAPVGDLTGAACERGVLLVCAVPGP